ncbi:MAG: hypothetical protein EBZ48_08055, partial [Proteobacteria bacterium]|nr:hypothetical protein [Pseudomonadota bacterium]
MRSQQLSSLTPYIALAMLLGLGAGAYFGTAMAPLGEVGKIYIQLIKGVAIPLVLCSIIDAVLATELSWRSASRWLAVIAVNTTCALVLGLLLSNIFTPGHGFISNSAPSMGGELKTVKDFSLAVFLSSIIPESVVAPFAQNNVLSVVMIALLIGFALRRYLHDPNAEISLHSAQRLSRALNAVVQRIVLWLLTLVPFAVFCVTARTVGEYGFAPFKNLVWYVGLSCGGLLLQIVLVYPLWVRWVGKIPLRVFWQAARRPAACAFGTNSSLATLPVTLHALDTLEVPKSASRLGACIGTNFNNDGILL